MCVCVCACVCVCICVCVCVCDMCVGVAPTITTEAALDAEMAELQDTIDSMKPEGIPPHIAVLTQPTYVCTVHKWFPAC